MGGIRKNGETNMRFHGFGSPRRLITHYNSLKVKCLATQGQSSSLVFLGVKSSTLREKQEKTIDSAQKLDIVLVICYV